MEFPIGKKFFHLVINPSTSRCPTVDLELVQTTRNVNGTRHSVRKFQPGKRANLFRFSTFSGNFQWDGPTKRVPFTAENGKRPGSRETIACVAKRSKRFLGFGRARNETRATPSPLCYLRHFSRGV